MNVEQATRPKGSFFFKCRRCSVLIIAVVTELIKFRTITKKTAADTQTRRISNQLTEKKIAEMEN